jgi:hypothetical protein
MPVYGDPLKGVSLSQALKAAATVAPAERAVLSCFEFRHSRLPAPVRLVNNSEDFFATLEATAPVNASTEVEFLACDIAKTEPEESDQAASPDINLQISNISHLVTDALKLIRGSRESLLITERLYTTDDTSAPHLLPVTTWEVSAITIVDGGSANLRASYGDPVNIAVPKTTIKRSEYPALER